MDESIHVDGVGSVVPGRFGRSSEDQRPGRRKRRGRRQPSDSFADDTYEPRPTPGDGDTEARLRTALEHRQAVLDAQLRTWPEPAVPRLTLPGASAPEGPRRGPTAAGARSDPDDAGRSPRGLATVESFEDHRRRLTPRSPVSAYESTGGEQATSPQHLVDTEG